MAAGEHAPNNVSTTFAKDPFPSFFSKVFARDLQLLCASDIIYANENLHTKRGRSEHDASTMCLQAETSFQCYRHQHQPSHPVTHIGEVAVPNRRHYGGSTHNDPHLNPARRPRLTPARPAHLTLLFFCFQASPARALSPSLGPAGAYEVPLLEDQGRLLKHPSSSVADHQDCPPTLACGAVGVIVNRYTMTLLLSV